MMYRFPVCFEIGKYLLVGGLGFLIDLVVFIFLLEVVDVGFLIAKSLSFLHASFITWILHTKHTFQVPRLLKTKVYLGYLCVVGFGAFLNVVFASVFMSYLSEPSYSAALSSICLIIYNYYMSKRFVFRERL